MRLLNIFIRSVAFVMAAACALAAHAEYPDRFITLVVPYSAGGAADALARVVAGRLGAKLGKTVVVDNRAGASGTIGAAFVAKAAADGYTMLYDATPFSINPHLYPKLPYAPSALQAVTLVSLSPQILIVKAESPIKDVKSLVASARAAPGKLNFASGGAGTVQRLAFELFRQQLDLDAVHVAYKSGSFAVMDITGGQVDFGFSTIAACYPLIASGKLRALAVSSPERIKRLPSVPTVAESVIPGFDVNEWNGVFVPVGTPEPVAARLQKALTEVLHENEVKQRFADLGAQPVGSTAADFAAFLKKEDARWGEVIGKGNIKLD